MIGLIVDSSSDVTDQQLRLFDVKVVSSYLHFDDQTYKSHQVTPQQVIDKVYDTGIIPVSAPPSVEDYEVAYLDALARYDQILSFHISSKLSQSYENGLAAAKRVDPKRISVIDCPTGSYAMGMQVLRARYLLEQGKEVKEVLQLVEYMNDKQFFVFALDTVEFLRLSKRVSNVAAFSVNLLRLKPILKYQDGVVKPYGRTRGMDKALLRLAVHFVKYTSQYGRVRVSFLYTPGGEESAEKLKNTLLEWGIRFEDHGFRMASPAATTINGPGAVGIIAEPVLDGIDLIR